MTRSAHWSIWTTIGIALAAFILANVHFIYVAFESDPGCVEHLKAEGVLPGQYRAAKSSC